MSNIDGNKLIPILDNLPDLVRDRVKSYDELDLLQQFAMFMGKTQILELALKNVLAQKFKYDMENMERWTLGRVKNELEKSGVRPDFIVLLDSLTNLRNFIAHELLAAETILLDAIGKTGRLNLKQLHKGIWELEQILLIVDWQDKNDGWH